MATKKIVKKVTKKTPTKTVSTSQPMTWVIVGIVAVLAVLLLTYKPGTVSTTPPVQQSIVFDFSNKKIRLNDQELPFVNGLYSSSDAITGAHTASMVNRSVSPSGTRAAAILIDSPGGSGTFSYVIGSTRKDGKETYSVPVLLGDRIKVVAVHVDDAGEHDSGIITVDYLVRPSGAAMAAEPTEKMTTKYAFQEDGNLVVVLN